MSGARIKERMAAARRDRRLAFIPYLTGGDPDRSVTDHLVRALDRAGADLIEIGVPFSDPVADGEVNQRAAERALAGGTDLGNLLDTIGGLRAGVGAGLVLFTYYNPLLRYGLERFAAAAAAAGVDGVLAVDLPPEEAGEYRQHLGAAGIDTVFLAAPTSDPERLRRIATASTGFLYYVSRTGVTGADAELDPALLDGLARVRAVATCPVVVGFGLSRPEQIAALRGAADGVVVGSALVRQIAAGGTPDAIVDRVERLVGTLLPATRAEECDGRR